jgi:penicillin-binding protein 2
MDERKRDHSLYTAFAPADHPKIALALIVENAGFGAAVAAPIARKVMDYYLTGKWPEELQATAPPAASAIAPAASRPSTAERVRHGPDRQCGVGHRDADRAGAVAAAAGASAVAAASSAAASQRRSRCRQRAASDSIAAARPAAIAPASAVVTLDAHAAGVGAQQAARFGAAPGPARHAGFGSGAQAHAPSRPSPSTLRMPVRPQPHFRIKETRHGQAPRPSSSRLP